MVIIIRSDLEFRRESNQFVHCADLTKISTLHYWQAETKRVWQKNYLWSIYFGSEMLIMIRVRALAYLLLALAECNEY